MSSPAYQAGYNAAQHGQNKPHSHNYTERVQIAQGWNAGGGNK